MNAVCKFVKSERGENQVISSAEKTTDTEEKRGNGNINKITFKREKLKGKLVSSNIINLSRRNLPKAKIFLLCNGLKFFLQPIK